MAATVSRWLGVAAGLAVCTIMVAVCWSVVARTAGGRGLRTVEELTGSLTMFAVFIALGYTLRVGGHVRAELLVAKIPGRYRRVVELATTVLVLGVAAILTVACFNLWTALIASGAKTPSGQFDRWVPTTALVVGSAWLIVEIILRLLRLLFLEDFTDTEELHDRVPDL